MSVYEGQAGIPGDLPPEHLEELRRNFSTEDQLRKLAAAVELLATQSTQQLVGGFDSGSSGNPSMVSSDAVMQRLGIAEANARMAEAGIHPIDTVEGKIAALRFTVEHVVELAKLGPKVRLEAEKQIFEYRKQLITERNRLEIARLASENEMLAAQSNQITLHHELEVKRYGAIEEINVDAAAAEAERDRHRVAIERTKIVTAAERASLERKQKIARLREEVKDRNEIRRLRQELWGRRTRIAVVAFIILIIVSNLVADNPPDRHVFLLGFVNQAWDAIYMPIRAGIVHAFDTTF
jgi:hypothetical protein